MLANIGAGQLATPNIADQAITTPKIAPGAVSITAQRVDNVTEVQPNTVGIAKAQCPSGSVITGGGYLIDIHFKNAVSFNGQGTERQNGWTVTVQNQDTVPVDFNVFATCITIHP